MLQRIRPVQIFFIQFNDEHFTPVIRRNQHPVYTVYTIIISVIKRSKGIYNHNKCSVFRVNNLPSPLLTFDLVCMVNVLCINSVVHGVVTISFLHPLSNKSKENNKNTK